MTKDRLTNEYFEWMYNLVCGSEDTSYRKLLYFLHSKPFYYSVPLDDNRYADGVNLRYTFGDLNGYSNAMIASLLDTDECSVLEMMVALSYRCETEIMNNIEIGDRTGVWFMTMLESLGLIDMNDYNFDRDKCSEIIDIFLDRNYRPNGEGGLFTLSSPHKNKDLRNVEIWCQLMWYLNELDELEEK